LPLGILTTLLQDSDTILWKPNDHFVMKTRLLSLIACVSMAPFSNACGILPEPGAENIGLRLRLVIRPSVEAGKEGFDVRIEVLNVSKEDVTLRAAWMYENDNGDLQEYLAAATSIESYPAFEPWIGQIQGGERKSSQPEYGLKAGSALSISWHTQGRRLKNRVTDPNRVQNPEFAMPGLYSVHASLIVNTRDKDVLLRSNEQLVPIGGSYAMPKHTYGTIFEVDKEARTALLNLGALHKIERGDEFRTGTRMGFWKLIITDVRPDFSIGRLEPLLQIGANPTNPNPPLPEKNMSATLVPKSPSQNSAGTSGL
jgi:hypothetical protein